MHWSDPVTSIHNPRLKTARAVRAGLDREHLLLEGWHLLAEALAAGVELLWVLVDQERSAAATDPVLQAAAERGAPLCPCEAALLRAVSDLDSPPGVLALARRPPGDLEAGMQAAAKSGGLLLISAGVQDPGNVGAMVRSAAGLGASGFVALHGSASPWHPRALRGASGTTFRLPVAERVDTPSLVAAAERAGLSLWECSASGTPLEQLASGLPAGRRGGALGLVLGEEGRGVPPELAAQCERRVAIPMERGVESLNVAAAAAVLLYALRRRA